MGDTTATPLPTIGFFHWHSFGKWRIHAENSVTYTGSDGVKRVIGTLIDQRRECAGCGFTDINVQQKFVG